MGNVGKLVSWLAEQYKIVNELGKLGKLVSRLNPQPKFVNELGSVGKLVSWLAEQYKVVNDLKYCNPVRSLILFPTQIIIVSFTILGQVVSICFAALKQVGYCAIKKLLKLLSGMFTYCALVVLAKAMQQIIRVVIFFILVGFGF